SAHATSSPPSVRAPTVPGDTSARLPVSRTLAMPKVKSPSVVRGAPQGEGNGKKSDARTKRRIRWAGRFQDKRPLAGTSRPKDGRLLRSCGTKGNWWVLVRPPLAAA